MQSYLFAQCPIPPGDALFVVARLQGGKVSILSDIEKKLNCLLACSSDCITTRPTLTQNFLIECEPGSGVMGHMTDRPDTIWLSRKQLAQRLSLPEKTPAEWATKGTGPPYARFGKHVRYRLADVIEWENSRVIPTA